jgi:predicted RNase H-like HicB family nuclease
MTDGMKQENDGALIMIKYLVIYEKTDTGYSAYIPDLPGCVATGETKTGVEENIYKAISIYNL